MGIFNPHILFVESQNSDWGSDGSEFTKLCECEDQPNSGGRSVANKDGESIQYSSILFIPKYVSPISYGTNIEVREQDGTTRLKGRVIRFSKDFLLRNRVWIA